MLLLPRLLCRCLRSRSQEQQKPVVIKQLSDVFRLEYLRDFVLMCVLFSLVHGVIDAGLSYASVNCRDLGLWHLRETKETSA